MGGMPSPEHHAQHGRRRRHVKWQRIMLTRLTPRKHATRHQNNVMPIEREKLTYDTVMDITEERIARVYAVAFMDVAAKSPNAAELIDEVDALVTGVLD